MLVAALLCATFCASCAARTGDFGRPERSIVQDGIAPFAGRAMARLREEPVSHFAMTDAEEELRDRTYRFVMPIHRRGFFARARTELVRTRIWPDTQYTVDPASYYEALRGDGFRSEVGRYNAMHDEIVADAALITDYLPVANEVAVDDAARLSALGRVSGLTVGEEEAAIARVYENRRVVVWAVAALRWRVASYRYALERTRIELPAEEAVEVEIALHALSRRVEAMAAEVGRMTGAAAGERLVLKG